MKMISALLLAALLTGIGCGYGSTATTPATAGAMPAIAQLAPNSAPAGSAGLTLTVNGSNFSTTAVVNWNGTALTTTYVTGSQLTAAVPTAALATAATVPVTVTNPATMGGVYGGGTLAENSNSTSFTIQ
jgi:hypothetical protein